MIRRWFVTSAVSLALGGLHAGAIAHWRRAAAATGSPRATSCVFVFLFGGPSQLDLWDLKPDAPVEIRGEFQPILTTVPGIQICEHLPKLAQAMSLFTLIRSMAHRMPVNGPACSEI